MILAWILSAAALFAVPAPAQNPQEDLQVARGVLEKALKDHPRNAELHTLLGFVFRRMDRLDDAERSFSQAVKFNARKAEAHFMLGMIREKKGLIKEAKASWQACLDSATEPGMRETARRHLSVLESRER